MSEISPVYGHLIQFAVNADISVCGSVLSNHTDHNLTLDTTEWLADWT